MPIAITQHGGFGQSAPADQPFLDTTAYGSGPDDSITDTTEAAAVTHHVATLGGVPVPYTATAGHLVAVDPSSSKPAAKFFYVAFTADGVPASVRPVTFFYNGGPGSSAVFVMLGSFAPRRIRTSMPGFTPPPPYTMEDNPDSLIDRSDLVFINPVGTGYSSAITPFKNRDFWGVDQDARSIKQFIKRYLTAFNRWNSPKFLFGESYGTARSCVLGWLLHEDGIDLNGITLQSSVLDYPANFSNAPGLMPTFAADAWYHKRVTIDPPPADLPSFMDLVTQFAQGAYAQALSAFPNADPASVATLSKYLGLPASVLTAWGLNVEASDRLGHSLFLITLLQAQGVALGAYDGRVIGVDTGISAIVAPDGGMNDPTMVAVGGVYTAMWNNYLNTELKFTSTSNFIDLNDQAFQFWDFSHTDPAGSVQVPDAQGNPTLYTAGDLAATMAANPFLQVLSANGYYDSVTPFFQTKLTLDGMPLQDSSIRANLTIRNYPSGHMIYLDGNSRTALKADLAVMYDAVFSNIARRKRAAVMVARTMPKDNMLRPYFKLRHEGGPALRPAAAAETAPWQIGDLCKAYDWPNTCVGGGVIAIIEFGGGWTQGDIDAFFQAANLPAPTITDVPLGAAGNNPNQHLGDPDSDPDGEVALDIEIAAAAYSLATGRAANVRVYWADASDWGSMAAAITAAAADGCDVCSISWGSDEANWQTISHNTGIDYVQQLNAAAQAATNSGMIVFAAAGDNDSSDGGPDPSNVDLPSSSPFVIGCGGTTKTHDTETVWNNSPGNPNGHGTGGGFSQLFQPMPSWQAGAPHGPGRMVPDVSADADPDSGYQIVVHGQMVTIGGTSAVAPLYAGLFGAFGRKLGFVTPQLWLYQTCFNDITDGDNGFFRARRGPDACTGIGSPIGSKLAALFHATTASGQTGALLAAPARLPRHERDHRRAGRLRGPGDQPRRRAGRRDLRQVADGDQLRPRGPRPISPSCRRRSRGAGARPTRDEVPISINGSRRSAHSLDEDLTIAAERSQSPRAERAAGDARQAVETWRASAVASPRARGTRGALAARSTSSAATVDSRNQSAGQLHRRRRVHLPPTSARRGAVRHAAQPCRNGSSAAALRPRGLAARPPHHPPGCGRFSSRRAHRPRGAGRRNPAWQRRRTGRAARGHGRDARQHPSNDGTGGGAAPLGAGPAWPMLSRARMRGSSLWTPRAASRWQPARGRFARDFPRSASPGSALREPRRRYGRVLAKERRFCERPASGLPATTEARLANGRWLRISQNVTQEGGFIAVCSDVTALKDKTARLESANLWLDAAFGNIAQGLCLYDAENRLKVVNRRFCEIFRLAPDRVVPGISFREVLELSVAAGNHIGRSAAGLLAEEAGIANLRASGDTRFQELSHGRVVAISRQTMADGGWVATYEDVTERRRAEAQIVFMARHDALTGLPNRILFSERVEQALAQVAATRTSRCCCSIWTALRR